MSDYLKLVTEDLRLVALRVLAQAPGYTSNESMLQTAVRRFGHALSRDTMKAQLVWLEEQQLVTCDRVGDFLVCTLTPRGLDVSSGAAVHPGVKRPGPGA